MAGDKRLTFPEEKWFEDNDTKVRVFNNFIYGTAGSGELSNYFDYNLKANNLIEFLIYTDGFFEMLDKTKYMPDSKENWINNKLDLTVQVAGISDGKPYLALYQILWNEVEFLKGVVRDNEATQKFPCFVMPKVSDESFEYVENFIKGNHPLTVEEAKTVSMHLMEYISKVSKEVSKEFDFLALEI